MVKNSSKCVNYSDEVIEYVASTVTLDKTELILDIPFIAQTFDSETDGFLSEMIPLRLDFEVVDKSAKSCFGEIAVQIGVDI